MSQEVLMSPDFFFSKPALNLLQTGLNSKLCDSKASHSRYKSCIALTLSVCWKIGSETVLTAFGQTGLSLVKTISLQSIQRPLSIGNLLLRPIMLVNHSTHYHLLEIKLYMDGFSGGREGINT